MNHLITGTLHTIHSKLDVNQHISLVHLNHFIPILKPPQKQYHHLNHPPMVSFIIWLLLFDILGFDSEFIIFGIRSLMTVFTINHIY